MQKLHSQNPKKLITDEIILKDILSDYNKYTDRFELYSSRKKDSVRKRGYYYVSPANRATGKEFISGSSAKNRTQRVQGTG